MRPARGAVRSAILLLIATAAAATPAPPADRPNVVLILCDDLGYGDLGCYGNERIRTPRLDRMAAEGLRFTDFYAAASVCTPSRAALLTGCYPARVSLPHVLDHRARIGIHADEVTIAEALKPLGYATACFGKWHLGHLPPFLPTRHGFDEYFGLPYSNDMWPFHPRARPGSYPFLPLVDGETVIERSPDQTRLTSRYTDRAVDFIRRNRDRPFFLYLPHSMPHVPLHAAEAFRGKSPRGLYGDVVEEIDASVGKVLDVLAELGLDRKTLVVFTSDNGPWLQYGEEAGSAGRLRFGKGTTWEGGLRVPCILRWPGKVPAGTVCPEVSTAMDLFPTIARLAGATIPADRRIDGKDISPLLLGEAGAGTPREAFFYYRGADLEAVRSGKWKLHAARKGIPHETFPATSFHPASAAPESWPRRLYDLEVDTGELHDVSAEHPEVVSRLEGLLEVCREDLGDGTRAGKGCRPAARADGAAREAAAREIRLIVRGDDLGMTQGSLAGVEQSFTDGILTCTSIIVPAPWFEAAAVLAKRRPGLCAGVHLCLFSEWTGYRWRPVLPWDKVRSLVDEDGLLFPHPRDLFSRSPKLEEIEAELRAQVDLAKKRGVAVAYLDTHMMRPASPPYPGLGAILERIAADYRLPLSSNLGERPLDVATEPFATKTERALKALEGLPTGLWLWVEHPGIDSPEQEALKVPFDDRQPLGWVARERAGVTKMFTDPRIKEIIQRQGILLVSYRDLAPP